MGHSFPTPFSEIVGFQWWNMIWVRAFTSMMLRLVLWNAALHLVWYHDSLIGKSIYQQNLATLKNPAGTSLDTEGRGITQRCCLITAHTSILCFLKFINFLPCHVPHRHTDLRDWVLHTTWNRLEWLIMPLIDPKLVGLSTMSVWKIMWSHYATRQYKTDRNSGCIWSHMYSLALDSGQDTGGHD